MYATAKTIETELSVLHQTIDKYPFATLIYRDDAIHLPLIRQGATLIGHLARANPWWEQARGQQVLVIFHGAQGFIHPEWYQSNEKLPTWNYIAIHIRGVLTVHEDAGFVRDALVALGKHELPEYDLESAINENENLLRNIVAFEIPLGQMEGKYKLAQSKSVEERRNVVAHLQKRPLQNDLALEMQASIERSKT